MFHTGPLKAFPYLAFILLLCSETAFGQVEEIPLQGYPQLDRITASQPIAYHPAKEVSSQRGTVHCVAAGSEIVLCVDTSGLGPNGAVSLGTCGNLQFGTASLDSSCVRYAAFSSVTQGEEQVCIEVCDSLGQCEINYFEIVIRRPATNQVQSFVNLKYPQEKETCFVPDASFPDPVYSLIGTVKRPTGRVITLGDCFRYQSGRQAGRDTIRYLARYDECLTDTLTLPVQVRADTLKLPFIDDFNNPGPYPDPFLWLEDQAFVNGTMAFEPVSLQVATLDGLDEFGRPYPESPNRRDTLTSAYLDLSAYTLSDNIVLTFKVQAKGLGFAPEIQDSLIVEFKNDQGTWKEVGRIAGLNPIQSDPLPFANRAFGISNTEYLYKGFQFRFRNKSKLPGALALWHIAYVRLDEDLDPSGKNLDISFTRKPNTLLQAYSAMPWRHFKPFADKWLYPKTDIGLYNHFDGILTANPSEVTVRDQTSGEVFVENINLLDLPPIVSENQLDLEPGHHDFLNDLNAGSLADDLKSFLPSQGSVLLEMQYRFEQNLEENASEPIALRNNITSRVTVLDNYFAFDDGTAESAIVAKKSGTQVAVKFESTVPDTLRAVQIHFPRYTTNVTSQYFNLRIWVDSLTATPTFQDAFVKPFYPDELFEDSLQGFTTYVLFDASGNPIGIPIPAGTFYVGWQQGTNADNPIPVGYDKNTPAGSDHAWLNTDGKWLPFPGSLRGALMLRPVVGNETPNHTPDLVSLDEHLLERELLVYPNPSSGHFRLETAMAGPGWRIRIIDPMGGSVIAIPWSSSLDLSRASGGLYWLLVEDRDGKIIARRHLVVTH